MAESTINVIRAWAAPVALSIAGVLALMLWNNQQDVLRQANNRITSLETTLAVVTENQRESAESRADFQAGTTKRLDQMTDVLTKLNDAVVRLTTIQDQNK